MRNQISHSALKFFRDNIRSDKPSDSFKTCSDVMTSPLYNSLLSMDVPTMVMKQNEALLRPMYCQLYDENPSVRCTITLYTTANDRLYPPAFRLLSILKTGLNQIESQHKCFSDLNRDQVEFNLSEFLKLAAHLVSTFIHPAVTTRSNTHCFARETNTNSCLCIYCCFCIYQHYLDICLNKFTFIQKK